MCMRMAKGIRWAFRSETWTPTKQEWLLGLSCVQKEERERVMKFVFKKDAKSSLIGRLLLRWAITQMLEISYNSIKLARTDKGKPYLVNKITKSSFKRFSFNISHQGDYTVLAAEPYREVGIDVMKTSYPGGTDVPGFFKLMRKQFTSNEWHTVHSQVTEWKQLEMFYRHWCLKESYVKAVGVGIGHDLQAVEFLLPTKQLSTEVVTLDSLLFLNGQRTSDWQFEETKLDDLHQVAVALGPTSTTDEHPQSPPSFQLPSFSDIISTAIPIELAKESDWEDFLLKRETYVR